MKGIYQITNKVNGKRYIGMSNNIDRRLCEHFAKSKLRNKNTVLCKAIRKYGRNSFQFSVIEELESEVLLPERERHWINYLKPEYNINDGGLGNCGITVSESVRAILREKGKAQWAKLPDESKKKIIEKNLIGPRVGHILSKETRDKLRKANIGKKQNASTKDKRSSKMKISMLGNKNGNKTVIATTDSGIILMQFPSARLAAEYLDIHPSGITSVLKGRQKRSCGYMWSYRSVETNRDECSGVGVILPHAQVRGTRLKGEEIVQSDEIGNCRVADRGLIQLAMRSGVYRFINAGAVYEGEFKGENRLTGEIDISGDAKSGTVVGYFSYLETVNGFKKTMFMSKDHMEAYAKKYSKAFSRDGSPWKTEFDAMAEKTMLRRIIGKYGLMTIDMVAAFAAYDDNTAEQDYRENANQEFIDIPADIKTADEKPANVTEHGEVIADGSPDPPAKDLPPFIQG